ncbi:MAG TPA: hydrogenase maturation nickel metallochaperone HypA [Phycisphaerae bacterium]|jgi:hydrogenase nickel incorporation protein HypA/HybF|nr:hydrogenase maturation nickel metallochaperone HypA [Phycisphaerae bacterium]
MHELSIALSIVEVAGEEAARRGAAVRAVHLRLGPLSGVVADALLFSWDIASESTPLQGSRLVIQHAPVRAWCPACAREQTIESVQMMVCPTCGTPTPEVRAGRELEVTGLEITDDLNAYGRSAPAGAQAQ